ncbi:MAG: DNA starvation/stationary phase protection protein [Candidatus Melainabacteria bacterium HGW-Melainabacteria-1]|nr:MAG: DNA starvation/stationary phase protection protein [Candidatus Melainabacteria bacterium HGW-Melainabacteria-1]
MSKTTLSKLNAIGLDRETSAQLAEVLNDLLASYQVLYMNVRGFHWNIRGSRFFELHQKYEELYTDLQDKVDELAERILTLNGQPLHSFVDYLERSRVQPVTGANAPETTLSGVLEALQVLLLQQRKALRQASELGDEGTVAILGEYIKQQEKLVWMYGAVAAT